MENDGELFEMIKKQRKEPADDVTINGASGKDIPNEFSKVYEELFNREKDKDQIVTILNNINEKVTGEMILEVDKVNTITVKEALDKVKANKSDPTWDFSSNFLKN